MNLVPCPLNLYFRCLIKFKKLNCFTKVNKMLFCYKCDIIPERFCAAVYKMEMQYFYFYYYFLIIFSTLFTLITAKLAFSKLYINASEMVIHIFCFHSNVHTWDVLYDVNHLLFLLHFLPNFFLLFRKI